MLRSILLLTVTALLLTGCGLWSRSDSPPKPAIEDAATCVDVADYLEDVAQDFINEAENAGMSALLAGPDSELFKRYTPKIEAVQDKTTELGCSEDEMRPLMTERLNNLKTTNTVGENIVNLLREQLVGR